MSECEGTVIAWASGEGKDGVAAKLAGCFRAIEGWGLKIVGVLADVGICSDVPEPGTGTAEVVVDAEREDFGECVELSATSLVLIAVSSGDPCGDGEGDVLSLSLSSSK